MGETPGTPGPESTPEPARPDRPCRFCQIPVAQPRRRDIVKDFCCDRHRAAYRDAAAQAALRDARAAVEETRDELARLQARLDGAMTLLERYQRHGTRRRKAGPVEPSRELSKALDTLMKNLN